MLVKLELVGVRLEVPSQSPVMMLRSLGVETIIPDSLVKSSFTLLIALATETSGSSLLSDLRAQLHSS